MVAVATQLTTEPVVGLTQTTVLAVEPGGRAVTCRVGDAVEHAVVAVAGGYAARAGDAVLVARASHGALFVLGVVVALREASPALVAGDGASASLDREPGGDVLRVRDAQARLLFEYRAGEGRSTVCAPEGDLELSAPHGDIALSAAGRVRVRGEVDVEVSSHGASVALGAHGARVVAGPRLAVEGARAEVKVEEARLDAKVLSTAVERARHVVGVLETRAGRVLERAKTVYRDVEELAQTRAGQIRMVAAEALQLRGKRAVIKAEQDVKVKGEKIHLA